VLSSGELIGALGGAFGFSLLSSDESGTGRLMKDFQG
jgi:hypothetical protein